MAIPHAQPGELIDIRPLGSKLGESQTATLIKTDSIEVIRLVVPVGKEIPAHKVPGEITVQCLEGRVAFQTQSGEREMAAGSLLFLQGSHEHAVRAIEDASLLITIQLKHKS